MLAAANGNIFILTVFALIVVLVLITLFALINSNLFCFQHGAKHIIVREEKKYCFQSLHHCAFTKQQSENMANSTNTKNAKVCSLES